MDLLYDLLKQSGLKTRLLGHRSFRSRLALEFPCSKSIGFHVVTQGECYIHTKKKIIHLQKGDIALMARGHEHIVSSEAVLPEKLTTLLEFEKVQAPQESARVTLVSGAYQFWYAPLHPLFNELPDWFVLPGERMHVSDKLAVMLNLLSDEVRSPQLGSQRVVEGILDVMFSLILRRLVEQQAEKGESWSQAHQDPGLRLALECMHKDITHPWSLDELASKAGMSRAHFAQKFKKSMGETPLHYLTLLRIQAARELLSTTQLSLESIAVQVGYQDPFGFSKAFKRLTGESPRDFRKQDLLTQAAEWRFS
ncbi:MAG: AraC family transcriptional regulator [Proteobacteria bacterium]|jgi:AraC-like DNA-binding protein|nr:AraC family transcriptional regulator [Pseudomonadota bacterium]